MTRLLIFCGLFIYAHSQLIFPGPCNRRPCNQPIRNQVLGCLDPVLTQYSIAEVPVNLANIVLPQVLPGCGQPCTLPQVVPQPCACGLPQPCQPYACGLPQPCALPQPCGIPQTLLLEQIIPQPCSLPQILPPQMISQPCALPLACACGLPQPCACGLPQPCGLPQTLLLEQIIPQPCSLPQILPPQILPQPCPSQILPPAVMPPACLSNRVVPNQCGLANPFLPAASPVSPYMPPLSPFLPQASPCNNKCQYLKKIPIPPPCI